MAKGKRNAIDNVERPPPTEEAVAADAAHHGPAVVETGEEVIARLRRESRSLLLSMQLSAPFAVADLHFKPQMVKNNRALAAAYIDARLVMDRLDQVCGPDGWKDDYTVLPDGSVVCQLSVLVRSENGSEWVSKCDVGSPSEQPDAGDRLKAAFSDALKRAAVKWGVGRYIYRIPPSWCDYDPVKKRLTQLPRLPDFAIPKNPPKEVGGYHGDDHELPAPEPVGNTGRSTGVGDGGGAAGNAGPGGAVAGGNAGAGGAGGNSKPAAAARELTREEKIAEFEKVKADWNRRLAGCDKPEDLNELISKVGSKLPNWVKPALLKFLREQVENDTVGWAWDSNTSQFYARQPADGDSDSAGYF